MLALGGRWTASATGLMCFNCRKYKIQGRKLIFPSGDRFEVWHRGSRNSWAGARRIFGNSTGKNNSGRASFRNQGKFARHFKDRFRIRHLRVRILPTQPPSAVSQGAVPDLRKTPETSGSCGSAHPSPLPQNCVRQTPIGQFRRPVSTPEFSISKFVNGDLVCMRGERFDISAVRHKPDICAEPRHFASRTILPVSSTMQMLVSLADTVPQNSPCCLLLDA